MNSRRKGQRTFAKALRYAKFRYPKAYLMPIYQVSRWAQPQPCDLIIYEFDVPPILVEVRTTQWGVAKPSTRQLARLPSLCTKQIWRFRPGETLPDIRTWRDDAWTA